MTGHRAFARFATTGIAVTRQPEQPQQLRAQRQQGLAVTGLPSGGAAMAACSRLYRGLDVFAKAVLTLFSVATAGVPRLAEISAQVYSEYQQAALNM
mmetsp:Transcript_52902/g.97889  ORF Transcript_52902/g.97889 Transcript_52902/m.97889 type:complete len:97 (+) Transcript_52902:449-739(+)